VREQRNAVPPRTRTLLVKSGQGFSQRCKDAKVRVGDGVSQQSPQGGAPSTGFTCFVCCVRTAKNARCCVPQLYSGVYCFFDFVEKTIHPTRMGSVRESGSLTHPLVTPIEGGGTSTHMWRLFWLEARCRGLPPANPYGRLVPLVSGFAEISTHVRDWGGQTLNRFHLYCVLLAHGKKRTLSRATALAWGVLLFRRSRKNNTPH